jgi:hypothetical protein
MDNFLGLFHSDFKQQAAEPRIPGTVTVDQDSVHQGSVDQESAQQKLQSKNPGTYGKHLPGR